MREVLFRGKRKDNGKWVYGMPCATEQSGIYAIQTLAGGVMFCGIFNVIPETIGQFTGLTDKNGKKIFEGDIVNEYAMPEEISNVGIVQWSETFMGWHISQTRSMYCHEFVSYEVIGNIHDNPELLKGE